MNSSNINREVYYTDKFELYPFLPAQFVQCAGCWGAEPRNCINMAFIPSASAFVEGRNNGDCTNKASLAKSLPDSNSFGVSGVKMTL